VQADDRENYTRIAMTTDGGKTAQANAQLISEAPNMLDALKVLRDRYIDRNTWIYKSVDRLIKRAGGSS
jgi:hypothetical protein